METQALSPARRVTFVFRGKAGEFFGIWIVNLLLSVLTLGIYSAWAKVRSNRYLYSNTLLDGASFDYLADPLKILKGRLIAFAFFAALVGSQYIHPGLTALLLLLGWFAVPWLIVRSRMFNARNTAWRNVRFNFTGRTAEAVKIFIWFPILTVFTLFLLYPYVSYRGKRFLIENHWYGKTKFEFDGMADYFYGTYLIVIAIFIVLGAVLSILAGPFLQEVLILAAQSPEQGTQVDAVRLGAVFWFGYGALILLYMAVGVFVVTRITNYIIGHTQLDGDRLESTLRVGPMMWLYFTNLLAIIFSVGLLIPWAVIRTLRYRHHNRHIHLAGDPGRHRAHEDGEVSATGEEVGEFFDLGVGI